MMFLGFCEVYFIRVIIIRNEKIYPMNKTLSMQTTHPIMLLKNRLQDFNYFSFLRTRLPIGAVWRAKAVYLWI